MGYCKYTNSFHFNTSFSGSTKITRTVIIRIKIVILAMLKAVVVLSRAGAEKGGHNLFVLTTLLLNCFVSLNFSQNTQSFLFLISTFLKIKTLKL